MKDIKGYEGRYAVTKNGEVISYWSNKEIYQSINPKGYKRVSLCKKGKLKTYRVSRLVAQAFIPNPDNKPEVNHKDSDRSNNHYKNLEWCTHQENMDHAKINGFLMKGENHVWAKLNANDVREIRWLRTLGYTYAAIAKDFLCDAKHVSNIVNRKKWASVN